MKYTNQDISDLDKSDEEKSQILAAWDILDCMFTGRTSSNNAYTKDEDTSNNVMTPQPLKSICEDTFLSCVNNSLYQQEDDDIDIDILFHQLFKNTSANSSTKNSSSSSSNTSSNINSKDTTLKK